MHITIVEIEPTQPINLVLWSSCGPVVVTVVYLAVLVSAAAAMYVQRALWSTDLASVVQACASANGHRLFSCWLLPAVVWREFDHKSRSLAWQPWRHCRWQHHLWRASIQYSHLNSWLELRLCSICQSLLCSPLVKLHRAIWAISLPDLRRKISTTTGYVGFR